LHDDLRFPCVYAATRPRPLGRPPCQTQADDRLL
jgi:hypothetical protein